MGGRLHLITWEGLSPLQRANEIAASLMLDVPVGVGPDGLLAALGDLVQTERLGSDHTRWVAAARLLLPEMDVMMRAGFADESLFLLALAHPGLSSELADPVT